MNDQVEPITGVELSTKDFKKAFHVGNHVAERKTQDDSIRDLLKLIHREELDDRMAFLKGSSLLNSRGLKWMYIISLCVSLLCLITALSVLLTRKEKTIHQSDYYPSGCDSLDSINNGFLIPIGNNNLKTSNISLYDSLWFLPSSPITYSGRSELKAKILSSDLLTAVARQFYWDKDFVNHYFQAKEFLISIMVFSDSESLVNVTNTNYLIFFDGFQLVRAVIRANSSTSRMSSFLDSIEALAETIDESFKIKTSVCESPLNFQSAMYTSFSISLSAFTVCTIVIQFVFTRKWFTKLDNSDRYIMNTRKATKDLYLVLEELINRLVLLEKTVDISTHELSG